MPSYNPPLKGEQFLIPISLFSIANDLLLSPTVEAGDFQISKDFGSFANLTTLPTVEPAGSGQVKITLSSTEMDADVIMVRWRDGDPETGWVDGSITIFTADKQFNDIPTVSDVRDSVWAAELDEPSAAFDWSTVTAGELIAWLAALSRNKIIQTSSSSRLRNNSDTADIAQSTINEVSGTFTRGKWE